MFVRTFVGVCAVATFALVLFASGPEDRKITDPKSITSSPNPQARPIPVDDLYFSRSVFDPAWSPDGSQLVFTCDFTGRSNIWKVPVAGGWPVQMVQSDDRQFGGLWSKDGHSIVYVQDVGGGEYFDLYSVPSAGGAPVNLTNTPDISEGDNLFSPDGKTLAISHKLKTGTNTNIALLDWSTRQVRKLTDERQPDRNWGFVAWSPDGSRIYANRGNTGNTDSDVYTIDVATGKIDNLTPHQGDLLYNASALSPDGRTLLLTSNAKYGAQNVALLDIGSRKLGWVTDTKWEAFSGDFSPDGKYFSYVLNADGRADLYLVDHATLRAEKLEFR